MTSRGLISTLYTTEKSICEHQDGSTEITQVETEKMNWVGGMHNRTPKSCGAILDSLRSV